MCFSSHNTGVLYPLLPFGLSSPVQSRLPYSQNAGLTPYLYRNFNIALT